MLSYKVNIFLFFFILFLTFNFTKSFNQDNKESKLHVIQNKLGFFLYEVDVPQKNFTRFDQIESSNRLLIIDSLTNKFSVGEIYNAQIFFIKAEDCIAEMKIKNYPNTLQNKKSINKFESSVSYLTHLNDESINDYIIKDSSGILSYIVIQANISYVELGKVEILIPKIENYHCCFSNQSKLINCNYIVNIENFKLIPQTKRRLNPN
jgi:hypothetical protein